MNHLETVLRAAALDLAGLRLRWAVVGGLAISARTEPRFTRDVDLVIAVSDDQGAEQAVHSLQCRGYHVHALDDRTRPQDRIDLGALVRVATPADLDEARHGVALIHTRGFQRERDLARDLERLIAHGI